MADITRNSYDETKRYDKVVFQRNRNVLDSELNELQDVTRINTYRTFQGLFGTTSLAIFDDLSFAFTGGTNQITIAAGTGCAYGYFINQSSPVTVTSLTTPGGTRTDCVWLSLTESEIDSIADATIAASALGETTRRSKFVIGWGVTENSLVPPSNTGEPWVAGITYIRVALLSRTASSTISSAMFYDRRRLFRDSKIATSSSDELLPMKQYLYDDTLSSFVDHLGFQNFGAIGTFNENWKWFTGSADYGANGWNQTRTGTGGSTASNTGVFGPGIAIANGVGDAAASFVLVKTLAMASVNIADNSIYAIEWSAVYTGSSGSGLNAATTSTFYMGLAASFTSGVPVTSGSSAAFFSWNGPLHNFWINQCSNSTTGGFDFSNIDGGLTPRHFRIEIIGKTSDSTASSKVNFYIDNVFYSKLGVSTDFPLGSMNFFFSVVANGTTANDALIISGIRSSWRRFATPSAR